MNQIQELRAQASCQMEMANREAVHPSGNTTHVLTHAHLAVSALEEVIEMIQDNSQLERCASCDCTMASPKEPFERCEQCGEPVCEECVQHDVEGVPLCKKGMEQLVAESPPRGDDTQEDSP